MPLAIGMIVLLLVVLFSTLLGMLVAASIGIKRSDRGHYRALRNARGGDRTFSGAARSFTGLRFVPDGAVAEAPEDGAEGGDENEDGSAFGRKSALV